MHRNTYAYMTSRLSDVRVRVGFDSDFRSRVNVEALLLASESSELESHCREAIENGTYQFILPDTDAGTFLVFTQWLTARKVETEDQELLSSAWKLGGDLQVQEFQNDVMQQLFNRFELFSDGLSIDAVNAAYEVGSEGSLFRKALVQRLAHEFTNQYHERWRQEDFKFHGLHENTELLLDIVVALCDHHIDKSVEVPAPEVDDFLVSYD